MFDEIKQTLHDFRVPFDVYFHENDLYESGATDRALARLARARQHLRGGRRDLAAHREVRRRQGPGDRQVRRSRRLHLRRRGLLPRQARARLRPLHHPARRRPPRLRRPDDGAVRRVRRRARASTSRSSSARWSTCSATARSCGWASGPATSSRSLDLVEAIGVDAARYALVRNSLETNLDIDLDLWAKATSDNPVFYVQYAHARVSSILRNAADLGLEPELAPRAAHPREGGRAAPRAGRVPARGRGSRRRCASRTGWPATSRTPPRRTTASTTAAGCCRWATRSPSDLHRARLRLVEATRIVLANGLGLLGVSAPERM